jgi:K+-transporting ATPase ATPase A chain
MTLHSWLVLGLFLAVLWLVAKPLGIYISNVIEGRIGIFSRLENGLYRICGVRASEDMHWSRYAIALLYFSLFGTLAVYALQRLQLWLPLNPQQMAGVTPDSSLNTAVSFVANTNWQGYSGEATMSYLTQMLGLAVQNFLSAATGIAVLVALVRGFVRHSAKGIGNAWVDLTRITLFILLPISFVLAVALMGQGAIQSFGAYQDVATLEPVTYSVPKLDDAGQPLQDADGNPVTEAKTIHTQTLANAPLASQLAIKMLGTNGGGILNANSAHPFENPTPFSNFLQMLAIFLIPAALCYTFGRQVGDTRQGWAILTAMTALFLVFVIPGIYFEQQGNPRFTALGVDQTASALQAGGNMEGKEVRFGIAESGLFTAVTTAASCAAGGVHRRTHDRPHAGIPRQEDRRVRHEDDLHRHPRDAAAGAGGYCDCRGLHRRQSRHIQSGRARLLGGVLRLHVRRQQQRQRLWWPLRQHAVLQHHARNRRFAGREKTPGRHRRHHADTRPAVRGAVDRHGGAGRCTELRTGAGTGPHC